MNLVLAFLKKNVHYMGNISEGNTVVMKAITSDRCPLGYRGVEVYIREDVLEKGLTDEFLEELGGEDE